MNKLKHSFIFLSALRSAILFVSGFLLYETLVELEKLWNSINPENKEFNFYQRKIIKFLTILILDVILLYVLFFLTGNHF
jgi:hypothetical protein